LGMGMILLTSPYVPISMAMGTMAGLDISSIVAHGICSFGPLDLIKEMAHDKPLANMSIETNKEFNVEGFLVDHVPHQIDEINKNKLMSNDTMIQNLKRLDVDNSSFEGHSITLVEPKHQKAFDADKTTLKKKKTWAKTSYSDFP
ncbi:hypothetical protein Ancab_023608, partial [Ancistrocladus abbreviatus]